MKKIIVGIAAALTLNSSFAFAVDDSGSKVNRADFDSLASGICTYTVVGGKWLLTAAHCKSNNSGSQYVHFYDQASQLIEQDNMLNHPSWSDNSELFKLDVSLWKLNSSPELRVNNILFLSDAHIESHSDLTSYGFGGTGRELRKAIVKESCEGVEYCDDAERKQRFYYRTVGTGALVPGDSGSPVLDEAGLVVGVHTNAEPAGGFGMRLEFAMDWVLNTIDGWHYPTRLETPASGGQLTIEVQSLHKDRVVDGSYTTGDVSLVGGSCLGAQISPLERCTLIVSSTGAKGELFLSDSEKIVINEWRAEPEPEPDNGSSSGGSVNIFMLLGLASLAWLRRTKSRL